MLIPLGTDAPVYHFPRITLGLIVANCVVFVLTEGGTGDATEYFLLEFGNGLHPLQWITCNFLHFGLLHIIGNMIFLWGFGLVVEGKVGWWPYLIIYLLMGGVVALVAQAIMLGQTDGPPGAGGASGAIFGLLAICLVWAPKNDVTCLFLFWFRGFLFDLSILWFASFYIIQELFFAFLGGFQMSSAFIHFSGAVVGLWVGVGMLVLGWVDCENWDLIAVMRGTHGSPEKAAETIARRKARYNPPPIPLTEAVPGEPPPERFLSRPAGARTVKDVQDRMRDLLLERKATAALAEFRTMQHFHPEWKLNEPELRALVNGLFRARAWNDVIPLMDEYIARFPGRADRIRLRRAGLAVQVEQRPRFALKQIDAIAAETLNDDDLHLRKKIRIAAKQLIEQGILELGDTA